ncbi:MAG: transcription elongation factor GreA [Anaerolineales bacterium]|nr:transcription elongation factor GreA [Anaerolineales bacterium]
MKPKPYLLTSEGLERLTNKLNELKTSGREKLAERLHQAFQDGQDDDFVDNAELEAARHEQSIMEGQIQDLEAILSNYQLIDDLEVDKHSVNIGARVTVVEDGFDEEEVYQLVGAAEADPIEGRISNESPLGRSLLGSKIGDMVRVSAPNGLIEFRVKKIEY